MRFWFARVAAMVAHQMLAVGVGWQIYALTGSALDLGFVGLAQFVPAFALVLVAGHAADRFDRRRVLQLCMVVEACAAGGLALGSYQGWIGEAAIFALVFTVGAARAFQMPAMAALLPSLVPRELFPRAIASNSVATQSAVIAGPAIGGLRLRRRSRRRLHVQPRAVPADRCAGPAHPPRADARRGPRRWTSTRCWRASGTSAAGPSCSARYRSTSSRCCSAARRHCFRSTRATSSRPDPGGSASCARARRWARSRWRSTSPAIRSRGHAGRLMFAGVAIFGLATIVFGVSRWFPLSLVALMTLGAADMVSVVVRQSLVQLQTPDAMRGRVSRGQCAVHRHVEPARRIRIGSHRRVVRNRGLRRARRHRHARRRRAVDALVSGAGRRRSARRAVRRYRAPRLTPLGPGRRPGASQRRITAVPIPHMPLTSIDVSMRAPLKPAAMGRCLSGATTNHPTSGSAIAPSNAPASQ